MKCHALGRVRLSVTPWTIARQTPLFMGFFRQEDWSGLPFPSPGDLPHPGKVKVTQWCLTLWDPVDYKVQRIVQARTLEWVAFPLSRGSSQPWSPVLQADSSPAEPQGKPKSTGVGRLSLLQQIFPNPELNRGLPHCRQILLLLSLPSNIIEDVNYYHYSSYTVI